MIADSRESKGETRFRASPKLVVALDAARAIASLYVVAHHVIAYKHWSLSELSFLFRFGQEAVLIFFLLSGFVIYLNENQRIENPKGYFLRRFRRIYPTLLVAIIVSIVIGILNGDIESTFSRSELVWTLLSVQDIASLKPGVIAAPFMLNDPLWSLSYEVWFYLWFPVVQRFSSRNPIVVDHIIGLTCCLCYVWYIYAPNHFTLVTAYFLVWWNGAMAARAYMQGEKDFRGIGAAFYWLLLLCVIAATNVLLHGHVSVGSYPALPLRHFGVAIFFIVTLFGPIGRWLASKVFPFKSSFTVLASISYGLYVLHVPLLVRWNLSSTFAGLLFAVIVLIFLAYLGDAWMQKWISGAKLKRLQSSAG